MVKVGVYSLIMTDIHMGFMIGSLILMKILLRPKKYIYQAMKILKKFIMKFLMYILLIQLISYYQIMDFLLKKYILILKKIFLIKKFHKDWLYWLQKFEFSYNNATLKGLLQIKKEKSFLSLRIINLSKEYYQLSII